MEQTTPSQPIISQPIAQSSPVATHTPNEQTMWSSFQNVLTFISLAFFAGSVYSLWSTFIHNWVPVQESYMGYIGSYTINGFIATLIVSAPVFIVLFYLTNRKYLENPELKKARSKRILNYFTLTVTFIILLSQTISTITTALNDKFTANFGLQVLLSFIVCGVIFGYYLYEVRFEKQLGSKFSYTLGCIALVILTVVTLAFAFSVRTSLKAKVAEQEKNLYNTNTYSPVPANTYTPEVSPRAMVPTDSKISTSTNTPTSPTILGNLSFIITEATIAERGANKELTLSLDFTCASTDGGACAINPAGMQVVDGDGYGLFHDRMTDPESLRSSGLKSGETLKGKLFYPITTATTKYVVTYNDSSNRYAERVEIQMTSSENSN